jgi:hypothetical protein
MMIESVTRAVANLTARVPSKVEVRVHLKPVDFALLLHEHSNALDNRGKKSEGGYYRLQAGSIAAMRAISGRLAISGAKIFLRADWGHSSAVAVRAEGECDDTVWIEPVKVA